MTKNEALDLALEWFQCYKDQSMSRNNAEALADEVVTAIKQARSAPVQEPVASVPIHPKTGPLWAMTTDKPDPDQLPSYPLMNLYTTPPEAQRQWVGLTDSERDHIWHDVGNSDAHGDVDGWSGRSVMAAIEARLKELNT